MKVYRIEQSDDQYHIWWQSRVRSSDGAMDEQVCVGCPVNPATWKEIEQIIDSWRQRGVVSDTDVIDYNDPTGEPPADACGGRRLYLDVV